MADATTSAFHTEINQLLSLTIDTFYSKKEVFLRELICNASNALDNMRFQGSTDKSKLDELELFIRLVPDKVNKTLSIIDTGIGMKKGDLENLGEIARFGTKVFLKALQACYETGADVPMDGHYGEGFYSAFLVAKKVIVTTKHTNDFQYIWEPQAGGSFTITEDVEGEQLGRGTKITLFLKEDQLEYLDEKRIKAVVKKYLKFISYPINLWTEKTNEKEINDKHDDEPKKEDEGDTEELDDCTPSYRYEKDTQRASFKTMIGVEVLNDHYVVSNESKEGEEKKANDYEEILYKCEQDRFEYDILLEYLKESIEHIEEIVKKLNKTGSFSVEDLSARSLSSIKILYGEDVLYVINALKENAQKSLPVILKRLKQKYEEVSAPRSDFNKLWAGVYSKYYHLSLQHDFSTKEEAEEGGDEQDFGSLETNMSPKVVVSPRLGEEDQEGGEGEVNANDDSELVGVELGKMEKKVINRYDFDFPASLASYIEKNAAVTATVYFHKLELQTVSNEYHALELSKRANRHSFYVSSKVKGEAFLKHFDIHLNDTVVLCIVTSRGIPIKGHYAVGIDARGTHQSSG